MSEGNGNSSSLSQFSFVYGGAVTTTPATSVTLTNPGTTTTGTPLTFTASGAGSNVGYEYEFLRNGPSTGWNWTVEQAYSATPAYSWTPGAGDVGPNYVSVWVRNAGSTDQYQATNMVTFNVYAATPATSVTLSNPGDTIATTPLTFTAAGSGSNVGYQYEFWRNGPSTGWNWTVEQAYSATPTYSWTPGAGDVGPNYVSVWVRNAGSTDQYQATTMVNFNVNAVTPATSVTLTNPGNPGPVAVGTTLTFTAAGSGSNVGYEYEFWLDGPSTNYTWVMEQPYSSSATYTWMPGAGDVGPNTVAVWVRNAGSSDTTPQASATAGFSVQ